MKAFAQLLSMTEPSSADIMKFCKALAEIERTGLIVKLADADMQT